MTMCLQTKSNSSLPNYLQKTDLLNSPAFHIINVLFAFIKWDFIITFFQTIWLQSRKSSSSFLPIITIRRNVPDDRSRLLFSTTLIIIPRLLLKISPPLWSGTSNTRTPCQFSREQPVLTLSKKKKFALVPREISKDNKSLSTYCNKKYSGRKIIHVYSASNYYKLSNFYSLLVEEERESRQIISAFHWKLPPLLPEKSQNERERYLCFDTQFLLWNK